MLLAGSTLRKALIFGTATMLAAVLVWMLWPAPNPTGRSFASSYPGACASDCETEANAVLSSDLGMPLNQRTYCPSGNAIERPDTEEIVEIPSPPNAPLMSCCTPDFITDNALIEVKFNFEMTDNRLEYIRCLLTAAEVLQSPLWLYVREDVYISHTISDHVQATGGDVVYYFRLADAVDTRRTAGMMLAAGLAGVLLFAMFAPSRASLLRTPLSFTTTNSGRVAMPPQYYTTQLQPYMALELPPIDDDQHDKLQEAHHAVMRLEKRLRNDVDIVQRTPRSAHRDETLNAYHALLNAIQDWLQEAEVALLRWHNTGQ